MRRVAVAAALLVLVPASAHAQAPGPEGYCEPQNSQYDPQDLQRPDAPPVELPPGFTRGRISIGRYSAPTIEAGPRDSREAIVLLHGNPGRSLDWLGVLRSVPHGTRVIAFDLIGFGTADKPYDFPYDLETTTPLLAQTFRELGIDRVHLVGHDIGSIVGIDWAAANPDRLASAVLFAGGIFIGYQDHHFARVWRTPGVGEQMMYGTDREGFVSVIQAHSPRPLPREFLDRDYDVYDRATRCAVLVSYRREGDIDARARQHAEALRPHDRPALVVFGDRDPFVPSYIAANSRQAFPHADVHVYENSGHWPFVDEEERTVGLMRDFFRSHVVEQAGAKIRLRVTPRHPRRGRRTRFRVRVVVGEARRPLPGALVTLLGRRARTDAAGRAQLVATPRATGLVKATALKESLLAGRKTIRVLAR
ncbi:MAG TPA: alpha/beta hydrolase [Thermoleophilaceae bacterium]|jgi:pimeloyl-ACP methyl ester carboxylesterase